MSFFYFTPFLFCLPPLPLSPSSLPLLPSSSPSLPPSLPPSSSSLPPSLPPQNILGPYDACQEAMQSMNHNQQQQLLGTFEATPSTPLHAVTGNPFDRQFASGSGLTGLVTKAVFSVASSSSSTTSIAQSRAELNRHSVAEAPSLATSRGEEKGGKSRWGVHNRNDHTSGPAARIGKQSSDSQFSIPNPSHRKVSKSRDDASSETGSRPSNVLPVKKREKGRVRPFKGGGGSSPTGNQQGLTLPKRSGTAPLAQGTGDLFKVDSEHGTLSGRSTIPESVPAHASPSPAPSSKRQSKMKKKHHPSSAPTSATSPISNSQPTLPSAVPQSSAVRKSHSSSANISSSSPAVHNKHRKSSSSSTSTHHSSHSTSSHPPSSTIKKQSDVISSSSSSSLHQPLSGNPLSISSDKERGRVGSSSTVIKSEPTQEGPSIAGVSVSSSTAPRAGGGSSAAPLGSGGDADHLAEKLAKKKRKKAKRERERLPQASDKERTKIKTENEVKMEFEPAESAQLSSGNNSYVPPLNPPQITSLSNPPSTSHRPTIAGQARAKVKVEKLNKQRPSNLNIE